MTCSGFSRELDRYLSEDCKEPGPVKKDTLEVEPFVYRRRLLLAQSGERAVGGYTHTEYCQYPTEPARIWYWVRMVWKDLDATPRVLRVRNPDLSEAEASLSSRNTSAKTRSFSIRSISGSWSSIWGRESTSRSHTDFSQGSASYGCVPFPSLLSNHHTAIQHPHKRFPIDGESKVRSSYPFSDVSRRLLTITSQRLTSRSDASSISRLPSTHHPIHNHKTACRPISSIHRPDKVMILLSVHFPRSDSS